MTYDQLEELGYYRQPDGSYSKRPQNLAAKIPHTVPQPASRPTLDRPKLRKEESPQRIVLRITRSAQRLLDADNFAGGCKCLIDQMRYAQLIPDDCPEKVEITFTQRKVHKGQEGTLIEILDCLD